MVVRELVALMGIKTDKAGFDQASGGMSNLIGLAKKAAAAFAGLAVIKFAKKLAQEVAELGDRFDKMALRTGQSFEQLQKWSFVAELTGANINTIEKSLLKLQAAQVEAADGTATYADEFKRLGVEVKDADGNFKDTNDLLIEMADAFQTLDSDAERTNVIMRTMGRQGLQLIPMFKQGSAAIREMMEESKQLGGIIDQDLREASTEFIDNQTRMNQIMQGFKNAVGKGLLPVLIKLQDAWIDFVKANGEFIRQNIERVVSGISRVMGRLWRFVAGIVETTVEWIRGWSELTKGIAAVGVAIVAIGALLMAGPIGQMFLLIALIGLVIDDFMTWREGGESVIGDLVKALSDFLGVDVGKWLEETGATFVEVFESAGKVVGALAETVFAFWEFIVGMWDDPEKAFEKFMETLSSIWGEDFGLLGEFAKEVIDGLKMVWDGFATWFDELWQGIVDGAEKIIARFVSNVTKVARAIAAPFKAIAAFFGSDAGGDVKAGLSAAAGAAGGGSVAGAVAGRGIPKSPGQSVQQTNQTTVDMTVNPAPGMDEQRFAEHAAKEFKKVTDEQNRAAMAALVPQAS